MRLFVIVTLSMPTVLFAAILAAIFVPELFRYPSECGRLCRPDFWESATVRDVAAEIESGADVNGSRGTDLNSPLHLAIQHNYDVAIVEYILRHGADPTPADMSTLVVTMAMTGGRVTGLHFNSPRTGGTLPSSFRNC